MVLCNNPDRPFGSVIPAMVTPMTAEGVVNVESTRTLAAWLVAQGCDGILVNGTTGESPTTHSAEKQELVAAVVEEVGATVPVIAGAGSNDTAHASRMAAQAAEAGADGVLIVTPYYSRPSQLGVERHIEAVAEAGGIPAMIYDVPARTGVRVQADTYHRLAQHPLIIATKDATGDIGAAAALSESTGLAWYSGDDGMVLPFLAHGGVGVVSVVAQAVPAAFATMVRCWDAGDHAGALAAFRSTIPAISAVNGAGMQAVMAKAAVEALGKIPGRTVRGPLVTATDDEAAAVRAGLVAAGVLKG
ncbi:MAG: 4-hydroxy-tetrahydrodipicolinate synthase [Cellulomonadaceae bacterium]|jgi:4-hydroxy-tetrahydrodipicolinate synthase|nr:4-hydroxy-tetrahydrodipicolinate synthase [Cellulomonadaceae bacterium]